MATILRHYNIIDLIGKPQSEDYFTNKMLLLPYFLPVAFLFIWFYSHKRALATLSKWPKNYNLLTVRNIGLLLFIMFGPLVVGIMFL